MNNAFSYPDTARVPFAAEPRLPLPFGFGHVLPLPLTGPLGPSGWRGAAGEAQLARRAGATGAEGRGQHLRSCREIGEGPAVENSLSFRTHGRWSALRANGAVTKKPQE